MNVRVAKKGENDYITQIYVFIIFISLNWQTNFLKNKCFKIFSCKKDNIRLSKDIFRKFIKIREWKIAVIVS